MEAPSFVRSRKLLGARMDWGGSLAPETSLRLKITLLAAFFRGQRPESESLSWLCLLSMWTEALLVTMRFLRTEIGNCRICSDWIRSVQKYSGLLPLVVLALSGPEEALMWLLSQLPKYSFCEICGNELEGLALVAWGQKSLFPRWPTLHHLFCYTGVVILSRDILVLVHPFMTHHIYCNQDCTQECAWAHARRMLPLVGLAWEAFWKATLLHPRWHQRKGQVKQRSWWYGTKSV